MPYVSDAQRKFMHAKHPALARRWDKKYGGGGKLPEHVSDKDKSDAMKRRLKKR